MCMPLSPIALNVSKQHLCPSTPQPPPPNGIATAEILPTRMPHEASAADEEAAMYEAVQAVASKAAAAAAAAANGKGKGGKIMSVTATAGSESGDSAVRGAAGAARSSVSRSSVASRSTTGGHGPDSHRIRDL